MSDDPLARVDWPVRTERLTLRRARPEDAQAVFAHASDPELVDYAGSLAVDPDAFAQRWAEVMVPSRVVVLLGDQIIGYVMVRLDDAWAHPEVRDQAQGVQAEIGYTFGWEGQGKGYATEAVRAVIELAFGPMGLRRVWASAFVANEPSWRLLERIGMRREAHTIADSLHRTRGWLDGYDYALLASEWPAVRART